MYGAGLFYEGGVNDLGSTCSYHTCKLLYPDYFAMIRVTYIDSHLLHDIATQLQQGGHVISSLHDISHINNLLAADGVSVILPERRARGRLTAPIPSIQTEHRIVRRRYWLLNPGQLELTAPDGQTICLSHNECCILLAAVKADGKLVSRKSLIEAMGQNFLLYDERRLEAIISRLRRKLAPHSPNSFPVRGVKGQGYLFKSRLLELGHGK